jgi:hypothetical protein
VNTTRVPVSFIDVNEKTGEIFNVARVKKTTAWKDVPTAAIECSHPYFIFSLTNSENMIKYILN